MPDGLVADVALQDDSLGAADLIHPRHGFVDRAGHHIAEIGAAVGRDLPCHVEIHWAVSHPSALAELIEFDALHLELFEPLTDDDMAPEVAPFLLRQTTAPGLAGIGIPGVVAFRWQAWAGIV